MLSGIVFDIKEFTVHDGPGVRVTVFLKGCPLRCSWCHNPEGLSADPQWMRGSAGERLVGHVFAADELAARLNRQAPALRAAEGGVTFSGGEPLAQAAFLVETIDRLEDLHVVLDTSGFAPESAFRSVVSRCRLIYFDLKLADACEHLRHTGVDNSPILRNLRLLGEIGVPFVARVPLIPGVTDTRENLTALAGLLTGLPGLLRVDLLPYNRAAGGKYGACGLQFSPTYDPSRKCCADIAIFESAGLEAHIA